MKTSRDLITQAKKVVEISEAEILLAHLLHTTREHIIAHPEDTVSLWTAVKFFRLVKKRKAGVPLAYLVRQKEFYGLHFFVNKNVLVPRPETERMVDLARKKLEKNATAQTALIDIGTGSGCIPVAVGKNIMHKKTVHQLATDISHSALRVAKKNAMRHNVAVEFLHGDLLQPVIQKYPKILQSDAHIIITANLPYLTQAQRDAEPSIQYEPHSALVASDHGLGLYRELLEQIQHHMLQTGRLTAFFEIDPSQSLALSTHIVGLFPKAQTAIYKDLAGHDRIIEVHI